VHADIIEVFCMLNIFVVGSWHKNTFLLLHRHKTRIAKLPLRRQPPCWINEILRSTRTCYTHSLKTCILEIIILIIFLFIFYFLN